MWKHVHKLYRQIKKILSIWSCSCIFYTYNEAVLPLSYQNQVTYSHSPGINYKARLQHHRTWESHLNYAGSGTDVMIYATMLQESIVYIFSSTNLSHWRTKQSALFTDPCSKHPPILVIKTIQWIIWWSFGFLRHAVNVCVAVFRRNKLLPSSGWLNLVQVVAEVAGMTQTCWLHGAFGANLAKREF